MGIINEFDNATVSIWLNTEDIISAFKNIKLVAGLDIQQLEELDNCIIEFREDNAIPGIQLNVPITLYTKLIVLRSINQK
jgi:hypothetical protein